MTAKSLDDNFRDWESHAFGFGYGSGEPHILPALKTLMELIPEEGTYDYRTLETALTPPVAWLLLNVLHRENIFDYGCSPRFAWLTDQGQALKAYLASKTAEELIDIACDNPADRTSCHPDHCNCDGNEGKPCPNPFWEKHDV